MPGGASITRMELKNSGGKIIPLYNASHLSKQLQAQGRLTNSFSGKVNSLRYTCRGRTSISGWFLTDCKSISELLPKIYAGTGYEEVSLTLIDRSETLEDGYDPAVGSLGGTASSGASHIIEKLYVTYAYAVTGVIRDDINKPDVVGSRTSELQGGHDSENVVAIDNHDNQMYVLYVVDYRYYANILGGKVSNHNVRQRLWTEASDTTVYGISDSFSWQSMLIDIWGGGGVGLNHGKANYPSLGPFNYQFWGVSAFDALHKALDDIDHTLIRNLDGTADVADMATYDSISSIERERHKGDLIEVSNDLSEPILPEKIAVVFPKWDYQFQTSANTDELTPQDYWHNRPIWYEERDIATLITASSKLDYWKANHGSTVTFMEGTFDTLHDGMIAQFDPRAHGAGDSMITDGGPTPSNNTEIEAHATARATAYIEARLNGDNAIFREIYRGYIPFTPTRNISSITWKNSGDGAITIIESVGRAFDSKFITTGKSSSGGSGGGETSSGYDLRDTSSRRVSQEFPGAPDHARLSEPVLRWAIVETKSVAEPGIRVNCDVFYGLLDGVVVFHDTVTRDIMVTNISKTATMPTGSRVMAYWNEQIREWVTNWYDIDAQAIHGSDICARTLGVDDVTSYTQSSCITSVGLLTLNTDTLLRSFYKPESNHCQSDVAEMLISINPAPNTLGHVIHSDGVKVRWSEGPKLGKHLIIGDTTTSSSASPPYVEFRGRTDATLDPISSGIAGTFTLMMKPTDQNLIDSTGAQTVGTLNPSPMPTGIDEEENLTDATIIFPNNDTQFRPGMHMSIKETGDADGSDNNCLKMRWTSPGVFGYIEVASIEWDGGFAGGGFGEAGHIHENSAFHWRLYFDDGVCANVQKVRGATVIDDFYLGHRYDHEFADCTKTAYTPPDPCPPE